MPATDGRLKIVDFCLAMLWWMASAFDLRSGEFKGQLRSASHRAIEIDGLWGLAFGNGVVGQPTNALFFTAGPDDEAHGLYGRIDAVSRHDVGEDDDRN